MTAINSSLRGVSGASDEAISLGCVIARERSDRSNLIKSPSLRGSVATEAISLKG